MCLRYEYCKLEMKLPCSDDAVIEPRKIRDYILSLEHPIGRFKALFFASLGITADGWEAFASQLRRIAVVGEAEVADRTSYGRKYTVRGSIVGPTGKRADVVTVWIVRVGERIPRLVTVYPEN